MKSLLFSGIFLFALGSVLNAQTTNTAAGPAKTADAPKSDATNQAAVTTPAYPVTAIIVSNTITFPILLSKKSEPLMTNAVYRRTFGRKVIFAADLSVQSFDIDKLHPSVLAQLDFDTNKAKADQEALDKQNQEWAIQHQQQTQQLLAAEAAALAKNQAAAQAAATNGANPANPASNGKPRHPKSSQQPPPPPAN
jgi:hypothetical protein